MHIKKKNVQDTFLDIKMQCEYILSFTSHSPNRLCNSKLLDWM